MSLQRWESLSVPEQVAVIVVALPGVSFTAAIIQRAQDGILRLVEGYWPGPLERLRFGLASRWANRIEEKV
jgi:hypothetical protein